MKKENGITLIALVITIIVLLILAGVSISLVIGDNGVLTQASGSVVKNRETKAREEVTLAWAGVDAQYWADWAKDTSLDRVTYFTTGENGKTGRERLNAYLTETGVIDDEVEYDSTTGQYSLTYTANDQNQPYEITIDEKGNVLSINASGTSSNSNTGNNTATADAGRNVTTSNRTLSGSTDTADMTYKNPVIPQGFKPKETATASWSYVNTTTLDEVSGWDNGLVIEDNTNHNEFVWVPCTTGTSDDVVTYSKKTDYPKHSSLTSISDASDSTNSTSTGDTTTYRAIPVTESTQIGTYGGFYVARFEAGLTSAVNDSSESTHANNNYNSVPVSIAGTKIWNYVDYTHSYVAAEKMVSGTAYGYNKSGLITGTQWDTIMKWFEKSNIGVLGSNQTWGTYNNLGYSYTGTQHDSFFIYNVLNFEADSTWSNGEFTHPDPYNSGYRHFHASGLNSSGYQKNIADLGGNVWEWTAEVFSDSRVYRGGAAYNSVTIFPASYRSSNDTSYTICAIGFRGVLYVSDTAQ